MRRLGYDKYTMTGHGFCSMASTILNEPGWTAMRSSGSLRMPNATVSGAAYNYAEHLPEREKMMQAWGDHLDTLEEGAKIIRLGAA